MKIIDNFINLEEQEWFYNYVNLENFAYRISSSHQFSSEIEKEWSHAPKQLVHHLYNSESDKASPHLPVIKPFIAELEKIYGKIELYRAKVNLTTPCPPMMKYESQVPHIDLQYDNGDPVEHKVFLYYINAADGPTYFFDESYELQDTVYPKMGRGIIFNGEQIHAASNPVHSPFRFVLNIDFKVA